jgi:hypothetical protein
LEQFAGVKKKKPFLGLLSMAEWFFLLIALLILLIIAGMTY